MHGPRHSTAHALTLLVVVACGANGASHAAGALHDGDSGAARADSGLPLDGDAGTRAPWAITPFPAVVEPADNQATAEERALGRLLFYDPVVSADSEVACATCHSEVWGMTDALAVSVGLGAGIKAGPGRTGPHVTRRNAPTLWNVAFRTSLFWDGRATSLENQVHFPFDSADEFARPLADAVVSLRAIPEYVTLFAKAFPGEEPSITETTVARAIASFERGITSSRGLYDAYVDGDSGAMSASMISGMLLFAEEGCVDCHRPPLFSSDRFEDRGVPPIPGVDDAGRFETTNDPADRNRFETATLRNLFDTGPYFHTGAVELATDAIAAEVNRSTSVDGARALDDGEVSDLTTFILKGLVDGKNSPTRPYQVPSGLQVPIDGSAIRR